MHILVMNKRHTFGTKSLYRLLVIKQIYIKTDL